MYRTIKIDRNNLTLTKLYTNFLFDKVFYRCGSVARKLKLI